MLSEHSHYQERIPRPVVRALSRDEAYRCLAGDSPRKMFQDLTQKLDRTDWKLAMSVEDLSSRGPLNFYCITWATREPIPDSVSSMSNRIHRHPPGLMLGGTHVSDASEEFLVSSDRRVIALCRWLLRNGVDGKTHTIFLISPFEVKGGRRE